MPLIPETWLDSQIVNTTLTGTQSQPDIAQLANGNILVTWASDHVTGDGSPAGTEVFGQIYDPLGTPIGSEFRINQTSNEDDERDSDIVALPGGGFIVLYHDSDIDGLGGSNIRLEEFDAAGAPVSESAGVVFDNFAPGFPNFANPRGAASSATSVMIVYDRIEAATTSVFFRIYDPTTNNYGTETSLITGQRTQNADIAVLSNGNYVVAAERIDQTAPLDNSIVYRIMNPAGTSVLGPSFVTGTNTDGTSDSDVSVTALTGGGFVLVWTQAGVDIDIQARVYDAAGVLTGATSIDAAGITNENNEPVVVGLTDGTFVVIYDNDETGVQTASHRSATGAALGSFDLEGASFAMSAVALADGRFAVTYILESDNEIHMEILDTRDNANFSVYTPDSQQIGTVGDDVFTASADNSFGYDGNDTITDGSGVNNIFGGNGDDTIIMVGVQSGEIVDGGSGINRLVGTIIFSGTIYDLGAGTVTDGSVVQSVLNFRHVTGSGADETLRGTALANSIDGGAGNDMLNGRGGADNMTGGTGNDVFFVNTQGDTIVETIGEGTADRVSSAVSYVLAAGQEVEFLTTTSAVGMKLIDLTGNEFGQRIVGNAGANALSSGVGAGAADTLVGLGGSDFYGIFNSGDIIVEAAGGGNNDRVAATVSFALAADDDIEVMTTANSGGTDAINLTGNALSQRIIGNNGVNNLSSGASGAFDTLIGLGGSDTYRVFNAGDIVVENAGSGTNDRVVAAVTFTLAANDDIELLSTSGAAGVSPINLTGNALAQRIIGNAGDNWLTGLGGSDTLTGGLGADTFVFNTAPGAANLDRINDFNVADDTIRLDDAVFAGLAVGTLGAAAFAANLTGDAADALDRIIYETDTGRVYFDADGNGAGARVQFATLTASLAVTNADFFVF